MSAQAAVIVQEPPRSEPIAIESVRPDLEAQANAGGTVRMFFNPKTGLTTTHPDSERKVAPRPMQPFGEQPTVQALPVQQNPGLAAPVIVRNPATPEETYGTRRKPRRLGRLVVLFFVATAASGATVHYWGQLVPWVRARLPAASRSPSAPASGLPEPSASTSAVSVDVVPSAAPSASAAPLPAAPSTGTAIASAAASASSAPLGSSAAAASASAQRGAKNKRLPPKK
jgi:hypothetical protein